MGNPQAFVEGSAQIIPVLVLALVADPVNRKPAVSKSGIVLVALGAGIVGEVIALSAVSNGAVPGSTGAIGWSMFILAVAILTPHVLEHFRNAVSRVPTPLRTAARLILAPLLGVLYLVVSWRLLPLPFALFLSLGVLGWAADSAFAYRELRAKRQTDHLDGGAASGEVPSTSQDAQEPSEGSQEGTESRDNGQEQRTEQIKDEPSGESRNERDKQTSKHG